jgi:hypothetical protein
MSKWITGILSAFLIVGIMGVYIPNAFVSGSLAAPGPTLEICNGNIAAGQQGGSTAEEGIEQSQADDTGTQSVAPEFNALTGNNLAADSQQNGECTPVLGQPQVDDVTRSPTP